MGSGLMQRESVKAARGRPSHRYSLTNKGRRQTGSNFADLTIALWQEIRSIKDPEIRSGLLRGSPKRWRHFTAAKCGAETLTNG